MFVVFGIAFGANGVHHLLLLLQFFFLVYFEFKIRGIIMSLGSVRFACQRCCGPVNVFRFPQSLLSSIAHYQAPSLRSLCTSSSPSTINKKSSNETFHFRRTWISDYQELEREFDSGLTVDRFAQMYESEPHLREAIESILQLYEREKYESTRVPSTLTTEQMRDLLRVRHSDRELLRMFKFMLTKELYSLKKKQLAETKQWKQAQRWTATKQALATGELDRSESIWADSSENSLAYGVWRNTLVGRMTKKSAQNLAKNRSLRLAGLFGQRLIVDLDFDQHMLLFEARLLTKQLANLLSDNLFGVDIPGAVPFDIHFTNCGKSTATFETLPTQMGARFGELDRLGHFHRRSYLDHPRLFPRHRLVYLSPHAEHSLTQYSHDDIYIIGGLNDKNGVRAVTDAKARDEGIRCVRLPLDHFVQWKLGSKCLCLNHVVSMLAAVSVDGDWGAAIARFVPQRKVKSAQEIADNAHARQSKRTEQQLEFLRKRYQLTGVDTLVGGSTLIN